MADLVSLTIDVDSRRVMKANDDVDRLGFTARKTGARLDNFQNKTQKATKETDRMSTAVNKLRGMVGLLSAGIAGVGFAQLATQVERATTQMNNINATMRVATGSAQAAGLQIQFIREESQRLGLFFPSVAKQMAQFSAAARTSSITGEELRTIFTGIAEASRAMGLTAPQAEGAMMALQQMMSKGKVSAEELRQQLGERMPGSIQIMASALDVTTSKLFDMMENGELLSDEVLPKFGRELQKVFGGEAADQATKIAASIQRLRNSIFDLMAQDNLTGAAEAIDRLAVAIGSDAFQEGFDAAVTGISNLFGVIAENFDHLVQFTKLLAAIGVGAFARRAATTIGSLSATFTSLTGKILATNAATVSLIGGMTTLSTVISRVAWPIAAITSVGSAIALFTDNTIEAKEATRDWIDLLPDLREDLTGFGRETLSRIAAEGRQDIEQLEEIQQRINSVRQELSQQESPQGAAAMTQASSVRRMELERELETLLEAAEGYRGVRQQTERAERALFFYRMEQLEANAAAKESANSSEESAKSFIDFKAQVDSAAKSAVDYRDTILGFKEALDEGDISLKQYADLVGIAASELDLFKDNAEEAESAAEKQLNALKSLASVDPATSEMMDYAEAVRTARKLLLEGYINGEKFNEILAEQKGLLQDNVKSYEDLRAELDSNFAALVQYEETVGQVAQNENLSAEQRAELIGLAKEAYQEATKAADDFSDKSEETLTQAEKDFQRVADSVEDAFSDAFYDIFDEGIDAFDDLADSIFDIFKRTLADMAAAAIRQQIVVPITQQVVGGASDIVSMGGNLLSGGGGGGLSSLGSLASGGNILGSLTQSGVGANIANQIAFSGLGQNLGLSTVGGMTPAGAGAGLTQTGGNFVSTAGAATSIAGMGGGFIGGQLGGGTMEANVGATAGQAIGAVLGGPIGAFLGGIGGGFLGGLFGGDDPTPSTMASIAAVDEGELSLQASVGTGSELDPELTTKLSNQLDAELRRYSQSLDDAVQSQIGESFAEVISGREFRSEDISGFVEEYFSEDGAGAQAALSRVLQSIVGLVGEELPASITDALDKVDETSETFNEKFLAITDVFANSTGRVTEELNKFVDDTQLTGEQFVSSLQSYSSSLKQLRMRGELDVLEDIEGRGTQVENLAAYLQTIQAVEGLTQANITQAEIVEEARKSLVQFSDTLDLTEDKTIDTAQEFKAYITSLDLTTEAGREAAQSALEYSNAFNILNDAFNQRVQEIQQRQQEIAQTRSGLETELLQSLGRSAALVRQQLAGMTAENAALQIAINLRENVANAQQQVAEAEQELASIYQSNLQTAEQLAETWKGLTETLRDAADSLLGVGIPEPTRSRRGFQDALSAALGGDREAFEALPQLASDLSQAERSQAGTLAEARRANARIATELEKAADQAEKEYLEQKSAKEIAQDQLDKLTEQELTIEQAKANVAKAEATLKSAQDANTQAINKLQELLPNSIVNGLMEPLSPLQQIDASTKAMVSLLSKLSSGTIVGEEGKEAIPDTLQQIEKVYKDELGRAADASGAAFYESIAENKGIEEVAKQVGASTEAQITDVYRDVLGRDPDPVGRSFYQEQVESGKSIEQIEREIAASEEAQGFAKGGIASGPMSGFPATLHGTEAVIPLNGDRIPLEVNNHDLVMELREVKQELAQLRSEQEQSQYELVKYTKRNNRQFEQWDIDGLPETRTA